MDRFFLVGLIINLIIAAAVLSIHIRLNTVLDDLKDVKETAGTTPTGSATSGKQSDIIKSVQNLGTSIDNFKISMDMQHGLGFWKHEPVDDELLTELGVTTLPTVTDPNFWATDTFK